MAEPSTDDTETDEPRWPSWVRWAGLLFVILLVAGLVNAFHRMSEPPPLDRVRVGTVELRGATKEGDRWVVDRAISLLEGCLREARALPLLAVNLSGTSINDEDFLDFVLTRLNNEHVARALCFEITETAAVASLAKATFFMRELKARGCRFALDDFGSGVSSFVYLKTMPVDFLKIDGQFAAHVATDPVDRSMVEAIAKIGRAMQVATIAEKVETEDVLAVLNEIGVDYIQGFHLGEPCAIEDVFH